MSWVESAAVQSALNSSALVRHARRWGHTCRGRSRRVALLSWLCEVLLAVSLCRAAQLWLRPEHVAAATRLCLERPIDWLQRVVAWLSHNPAGLKLNTRFNDALAGFYLYHIYLWRTYVSFVRQAGWGWAALFCVQLCALGGLGAQLALLCDIASLLAVHVFCFRIYAARLFELQTCALRSLLRLFAGKKYNELRARVDQAHLDAQQLLLGTLLFTFVLFLLPTTLAYLAWDCPHHARFDVAASSQLHFAVWSAQWVIERLAAGLHQTFDSFAAHVCG